MIIDKSVSTGIRATSAYETVFTFTYAGELMPHIWEMSTNPINQAKQVEKQLQLLRRDNRIVHIAAYNYLGERVAEWDREPAPKLVDLKSGLSTKYNRAISKVYYSVDCASGYELFWCPFSALGWFYKSHNQRDWKPILWLEELRDILKLGRISAKIELKPEFRFADKTGLRIIDT